MATSSITFEGVPTLDSDLKKGTLEFNFDPPPNLANQLCYAQVKLFQLSWTTPYTGIAYDDAFLLRQYGWPLSQCARVQSTGQSLVGIVIAVMDYNGQGSGSQFLCNVPSGKHTIQFTIERLDKGVISDAAGDPKVLIVVDVVPANSRKTPLN